MGRLFVGVDAMIGLPLRGPVFAAIASFAAVGVAHSADLAVPPLAPVADFSGWYLRGDIGFSNQRVGSLFNENYDPYLSVDNIDKGFDAAPIFGLGIGGLGQRYNFGAYDYLPPPPPLRSKG